MAGPAKAPGKPAHAPKAKPAPKGSRLGKAADRAQDAYEVKQAVEASGAAQAGAAAAPPPAPGGPAMSGSASAGTGGASAGASVAGPWFTFGLGGGLLAQSVLLFSLVTAMAYAAAAYVAWLLCAIVVVLFFPAANCQPPPPAGGSCGGGGGGSCNCGCPSPSCGCSGCNCSDSGSSSGGSGGCGSCCGSSSSPSTGGSRGTPGVEFALMPALGGAAWVRSRWQGWTAALSHHPHHPDFAQDVYLIGRTRLCVGCFTLYPMFLLASFIAPLLGLPGGLPALAAGVVLAGSQAASAFGWTRKRWAKVLVKSMLGTGLALAVHGTLTTAWPAPAKVVALLALLGLALLSGIPRARRMKAWHDARA